MELNNRKGRPNYPTEFKYQLAVAACMPGVWVSRLAQEHGINTDMLFELRRDLRSGQLAEPATATLYYFGASHPFGPLSVDVKWSSLDVKHSIDDAAMLVARATYALSRRTFIYTSVGHIRNDGSSAVALDAGGSVGAGMAQSGIMVGVRHHF
jgi:predicted porin